MTDLAAPQLLPPHKSPPVEEWHGSVMRGQLVACIVVKQGNTRIDATCGKCGAPNRVSAARGETRVKFACKECGHKQETL